MPTGTPSSERDLEYILTDVDWDFIFSQIKCGPPGRDKKGKHIVRALTVLKQAGGAFVPAKEIFEDEGRCLRIEPAHINDRLRLNGVPYKMFSKKPGPSYFLKRSWRLVKIKNEDVASLNNLDLVEKLIRKTSISKRGPELEALKQEILERLNMLNFLTGTR